jgi:hypothetical protein
MGCLPDHVEGVVEEVDQEVTGDYRRIADGQELLLVAARRSSWICVSVAIFVIVVHAHARHGVVGVLVSEFYILPELHHHLSRLGGCVSAVGSESRQVEHPSLARSLSGASPVLSTLPKARSRAKPKLERST